MATSSTNQAQHCLEQVSKMKFKSEEHDAIKTEDDGVIIFLDVEVFPNLFLINWKKAGPEHSMVRMINPSPSAVEDLFKYKNLYEYYLRKDTYNKFWLFNTNNLL